ncbi:hypothetical protein D8674_039509 [Pyrus ussuriensis x Pyrus communis]|uniref:Uncharacterized protein n=1 Tax=Pyrus ussuriensis x Pyrus communis TaxID=2448454 RepID=A0A5N5H3K4_9ROSA|nr:hypothetical protein D8674_039509 [Pyrus ussuriensis x Pyrus communis]
MKERHKIQVFQRELPLCLEIVTQLPKPKLLRGENSRFEMQSQITYMDNLSVLSRLQVRGIEMRCFSSFPKGKKSIGKTNGPVAKEPYLASVTSSTTDTVSGDSGGNNKKEEKDGQGNKGDTGYRSCTVGSCMLFSSTTWWFTWSSVEINLVGYVILYDWMNM